MSIKGIIAILLSLAVTTYAADCSASASIASRSDGSWADGQGNNFTTYEITVVNTGICSLNSVTLSLSLQTGAKVNSSWNLQSVDAPSSTNPVYYLTNFGDLILPGTSYSTAGFILQYTNSPNALISVSHSNCSDCSSSEPSNPTNSPTSSPTNSPTPSPTDAPTNAPTSTPTNAPTVSAETITNLITAPSQLERINLLQDQQFVFDFKNSILGITQSDGGKTVATSRSNFPAVIGQGVAMTVGFIEACGINLPHSHPRATEINFIAKGSFQAGFFLENQARFIGNVLSEGMATVFPQGAIHFEINLGCEPAMFVAAFNNEDPGVQTTASSFFGLPKDIVQTSLNVSAIQTVEDLAKFLPHNPAVAMQECMQRCGFSP